MKLAMLRVRARLPRRGGLTAIPSRGSMRYTSGGAVDKDAARKRLLEPLTDEEAERRIVPVTPEQIEAALRAAERELRPLETYARTPVHSPLVRYS